MVCLSVTFVHCALTAEDIDTISFAYDNHISLPDGVKFGFQPLPLQFFSQSDPVDFSVGDIRWQISTEWLEIAQWSHHNEKSIGTTIDLANGTIADPMTSLPTKFGFQMHRHLAQRVMTPSFRPNHFGFC